MAAMTITDESAAGQVRNSWLLSGLPDQVSVREIIRTRVREEVARFNLDDRAVFSGLVQPTETEIVANGYRLTRQRPLDWERQAAIAESSFLANGFFMLIDDRQIESLDDLVDLRHDPTVAFIKLVQLVGG